MNAKEMLKQAVRQVCEEAGESWEELEEEDFDGTHIVNTAEAFATLVRAERAAELEELKAENARLRAELEVVGAGGVQPLRAEAGWVLVPVEPTLEMLEAMHTACLCFYEDDQRAAYHAMLAATPVPRPARRNPQGTPAPQQEKPVVRALQSAILSGLSHEELLEKAHQLMTLTVNQARTIGELQEAAAAAEADAAPQQAVPPQKPELRVGQIWLTRGGAVAEIKSETPNTPYPFRCVTDKGGWTVKKDGRYNAHEADSPDDLIELISDVPQEGGGA